MLDALPGEKIPYSSWNEQLAASANSRWARRVAMQYSPHCAIPYVAMVDAGTVELIRSARRGSRQLRRTDPDLRSPLDRRATRDPPGSRPPRRPRPRRSLRAASRERTRSGAPVCRKSKSNSSSSTRFAKSGHGHRPRPHRRRQRQRLQPALRAHRRGRPRPSAAATSCCSTCGPSSTSPAPSTTTSPGPASAATSPPRRCANVFAVVTGARDAAIAARRAGHAPPDSPSRGFRWTTSRAASSRAAASAILRPPHRPLHRRGRPRQRRQHGQPRNPRRAPHRALDLLLHRARRLSARIRRALRDQHVRRRRRGPRHRRNPTRTGASSDAPAGARRSRHSRVPVSSGQPHCSATRPRRRRAYLVHPRHLPLPPHARWPPARRSRRRRRPGPRRDR